ncbi:hypothetical protein FHR83_004541 [Actinoplanes campanulatus]|uniref:Uncharacterized protein n=1 Tax=Actinoplanes campanulatus TaxID=113559 RepID=A0A7W5FFY6_9ACTN|nr:hypothetical protein [Actinoplanes campanulatus]MBB3096867.1 hypothetical protein [Actinoplanes campanulatus]GGN44613.1 hypothetical protein GCM10010109_78000 [Actinoplanes campanulatus]GID37411.1 hypothetical protein Aca09nite_39170 [Actinoplanes campanulatus]
MVVTNHVFWRFGNASGPGRIRPSDLGEDPIGPFRPENPQDIVLGVSVFRWPELSGLTGKRWRLPAGTVLPEGLGIHADGSDAGGQGPLGHALLFPTECMSHAKFCALVQGLPWERGW